MPTTTPHASIGEATDILKELDRRIMSVPEVVLAVGKIGRVESPLDPAPVSMVETIVEYHDEYLSDESGVRRTFRYDGATGEFIEQFNRNGTPTRLTLEQPFVMDPSKTVKEVVGSDATVTAFLRWSVGETD